MMYTAGKRSRNSLAIVRNIMLMHQDYISGGETTSGHQWWGNYQWT